MRTPPSPEQDSALPSPLLVTFDTNVLDADRISEVRDAARDRAVSFATVTVNQRERGWFSVDVDVISETAIWGESHWGQAVWGEPIRESLVLDETPLGSGVPAHDEEAVRFEQALKIISNGSFPPPGSRDGLTEPQLRQLRDAMTFEAHCRERRDLFVSNDERGFINHGRREKLETLGRTKILTVNEFIKWARNGAADT